jgi:hypothetical protein
MTDAALDPARLAEELRASQEEVLVLEESMFDGELVEDDDFLEDDLDDYAISPA